MHGLCQQTDHTRQLGKHVLSNAPVVADSAPVVPVPQLVQ